MLDLQHRNSHVSPDGSSSGRSRASKVPSIVGNRKRDRFFQASLVLSLIGICFFHTAYNAKLKNINSIASVGVKPEGEKTAQGGGGSQQSHEEAAAVLHRKFQEYLETATGMESVSTPALKDCEVKDDEHYKWEVRQQLPQP